MWSRGLFVVGCLGLWACGNTRRLPQQSAASEQGGEGGAGVVEAGGAPTSGGSAGSAGFAPFEPDPVPGGAGQPAMNLCRTCVGHDLHECDEQGEPLGLVQSCLPYLHCEEVETQRATCAMNDCIPASNACSGNEVRTCGDDGALPTTGVDCGEKRCFLGECHDKLCDTDGAQVCSQGDIYTCAFSGTEMFLYGECPATTHCLDDSAGAVDCAPMLCLPGEGTCLGNHTGKCAEDGQSLVTDVSDCAAQGQVCDLSDGCVASAVDTLEDVIGTFPWNDEGVRGIVIDVHSDRLLKTLAAPLTLVEQAQVSWLLYEQDGADYQLLASVATSDASQDGTFTSAAFDQPLRAGKRYILAVHTTVGSATSDYVSEYLGHRWSFAVLREGAYKLGPPDSDSAFGSFDIMIQLRATTEPLVE